METKKLIVAIVAILAVLGALFLFEKQSEATEACIAKVEEARNYIERKLCDPRVSDTCFIDQDALKDLDVWYEEELRACK